MHRVSIRTLMATVLVFGVGLAALRNADELWAGAMLTLALGLLGVALLGVAGCEGRRRFRWLGFALFEGGYLVLTLGPWFAEEVGAKLATTQALNYVHSRVAPSDPRGYVEYLTTLLDSPPGQEVVLRRVLTNKNRNGPSSVQNGGPAANSRWRSFLPGAAKREPFLRVGQCLFALLAGLVGATVAARFHAERSAAG